MNISNNIYNLVPIGHAITNIQNVQIPLRNYPTIYGNVVGMLLVLLVEETKVPGENHRSVTNH
jgi:hypothetical protein